jgi:hypothetical protein
MVAVKRLLFVTAVLLASAAQADGPVVPAQDASVVSVVEGGHWSNKAAQGTYRIVVSNIGYEHATYRVKAQWLRRVDGKEAWSKTLVEACLCAFDKPSVLQSQDGLHISLVGQDHIGGPVQCEFVLGNSGNIVRAKKC